MAGLGYIGIRLFYVVFVDRGDERRIFSTVFAFTPKSQDVECRFVDFIAHFIDSDEDMMHLARCKLIQFGADFGMIQQSLCCYR